MIDATISRVRAHDPSRHGAASSRSGVGNLEASTI